MRTFVLRSLISLALISFLSSANAQVTAGDCSDAINICSNAGFTVDPNGFGNVNELGDGFTTGLISNPNVNPNIVAATGLANFGCLQSGELNSTWMIINIASNGALEFSFGADGGLNCYDWIMWQYDPNACANIQGNTLAPVACNWNGMCESFTGMAGGPNGSALPLGADQSNFEDALAVQCGEQYIVCFSNYSSAVTNVPLNFFGSASISCTVFNPISVNDETICEGNCATLTATGANTYAWTFSPDLSATTGATVDACPPGPGVYEYYVTGTGSCGTGTDTATVTVLPSSDPLCSSPCLITNMTANIGACNPVPGDYSTSGVVEFTSAPASGQLIVEDCNGNQQVFNAPFASPVNYTITGQTPDGGACDITAYFTADPGCTQTINYTAPICPCNLDNFQANIGLCDQLTDTYCMTGDIQFTSPPAGGTLIVEVDNGISIYDTIINPPFVSGQTFSICGIPSNGANSSITVYFSNDPGCSSTINYTAPTSCACSADIGTFTTNITGSSPNNYVLCYGDGIDLISNGDWTGPGEMFNPPGPPYNPGISWLIYSCPPTVALTPDPNNAVPDDPCFLGLASNTTLSDLNNGGSWMDAFPPGTFTDNTVYFVPITMYDQGGGTYSYVNGTMPCYELGPPYAVQYLEEFTATFTEDCFSGEATITVNGGLPAIDGSLFTGNLIAPGNGTFVNQTAPNGGNIIVGGLNGGDNWTVDISDDNGCPYQVSGGPFPPMEDPGFNYPGSSWCTSEAPAAATVTGTAGGTFTSTPAGLSINPTTGQITPGTSTPGTYDITYTTPGVCFDDSTITVNIAATPSVNPVPDQTICDGASFAGIIYTGAAGSTFNWTNDNTNIGLAASGTGDILAFVGTAPTVQEIATITVTPVAGTCMGPSETFTLTVDPQDDPSFNYPGSAWCTSDAVQNATISGTTGGNFTVAPAGLTVDGNTGAITPATSTPGTYDVTYSTTGVCPNDSTVTVTINPVPDVNPILDQSICEGDNFAAISITGSVAGTSFDWTNDNVNTGLAGTGTGNIAGFTGQTTGGVEVSNVVVTPSTLNCVGTSTGFSLTVNPLEDPSFNYPNGSTYCQTGTDPTANITGTVGGTFSYTTVSGGPNLSINTATGAISLVGSDLGTYDITYTTPGGCLMQSTLTLTITDAPIADFTLGVYCANDTDPLPTFINNGTAGLFSSTPGLIINPNTGEVDLDASTAGTYTVNNTIDIPGCALASYDDDITIYELPDGNISGTTTICPSNPSPDITIDLTAGSANWDVTYNFNGNPVMVTASATPHIISGAAIGTYDLLTVTDGNGCTNTLTGQVVIDTFPTPSTGPYNNQYICEGNQLDIQAFTGSPAGNTYDWTNLDGIDVGFGLSGSGDIGTFTGINGTGSPISVTVEVVPTSANGCVGPAQTFLITVNPNPVVSFYGDPLSGCEPLMVNFTNTSTPTGQICVWEMGDGTVLTGCSGVQHVYMEGSYDVTLTITSDEGCVASETYVNYINVDPMPVAAFSYNPQIIDIEDTQVDFTNSSINATNYWWDFGDDSPGSNAEDLGHLFPSDGPGEYLVTLWAYNDYQTCYDSTQALIIVNDVLIFYVPNIMTPDGDEFNEEFQPVFTSGYDPYDYHLLIFNRWGEIVFESYNANVGWNGHYGDGGLVQDGVYVWQIDFKESMSDRRHTVRGHVTVLK